jgi:hypothetical protein
MLDEMALDIFERKILMSIYGTKYCASFEVWDC